MKREIPASEVQTQSVTHFPADTSAAAVINGKRGGSVAVMKMKSVRTEIVIGYFYAGVKLICYNLYPGIRWEILFRIFESGSRRPAEYLTMRHLPGITSESFCDIS